MNLLFLATAVAAPLTSTLAERAAQPTEALAQVVLDVSADTRDLPGFTEEIAAGGLRQGWVPERALLELAGHRSVRAIRSPHRAHPKEVTTEGYSAMFAEDWHALGRTGAGVRIAVLDVGFGGYEALLGQELPATVETHFWGPDTEEDHGTAVAEIIHDIAPDAQISLYRFSTEVEFLAACEAIAENGELVVSASIGFDNVWHADDSSIYSRAVNQLVDAGITWVAAAGNEGWSYAVGEARDSDGDGWLELGGEEFFPTSAYPSAWTSLRWDEPFGAAARDLDLYLYSTTDSETPLCFSQNEQAGAGDPYEEVGCSPGVEDVRLAVYDCSPSADPVKIWLFSYWDYPVGVASLTETLTLPSDASGAITVGGVQWWDEQLAWYSSRGPTNDGRIKPDVSAPTEVSTATYGAREFSGTSAATPHVAGVAALLLQDSAMGPAEVKDWLRANTLDLGPSGPDKDYGYGYLQIAGEGEEPEDTGDSNDITEPIPTGCGCSSGGTPWPWALALLGLVRRRRGAK